mgnify:CR=1 FL=1
MIQFITDPDELVLDQSYYSGRIKAACDAYGTGYDFCRLYRSEKGSLLIYNSSAVISGEWDDIGELCSFIMINSPETVECPPDVGERLSLDGYTAYHRTLFEKKVEPSPSKYTETVSLMKMYEIVKAAFGISEFELWYADMSHRIRHGVSRAFMCDDTACACADFVYVGYGYISQVAVSPDQRGKGYGRRITDMVSGELAEMGAATRLWAYDDVYDFYRRLGFEPVGYDNIYKR